PASSAAHRDWIGQQLNWQSDGLQNRRLGVPFPPGLPRCSFVARTAEAQVTDRQIVDQIKIVLALACVVAGLVAYYWFSDTALVLRVLMVLARLVAAGVGAGRCAPARAWT